MEQKTTQESGIDKSPQMRFNNCFLQLQNLPNGEDDEEVNKDRVRILSELITIAQNELTEVERNKYIPIAEKAFDDSRKTKEQVDKERDQKYSI